MTSKASLRSRIVTSAAWMVASRWSHRVLGLVSTMVLARMLAPADFGTVAVVMALCTILDAFFDFGLDMALIKDRSAGRESFDAAWTLRLLKTCALAACLLASSPFLAQYSGTPVVVEISAVIALSMVLRGFENIGPVVFQMDLDFRRVFWLRLLPRLLAVAITIGLAIALRSYWAIVLGLLANAVFTLAFSYMLSDYRPRFRLQGMMHFWSFAKWAILINFNRQVFAAADRFVMSGWIGKPELGKYSVSADLASVLTSEVFSPVASVLMPGYAQLQGDKTRLRPAFMQSLGVFVALALPACVGVAMVSPEAVRIVLGWQWQDAAHLVALFAFVSLGVCLSELLASFLVMVGHVGTAARLGLIRTIAFLILIYPAFAAGGLEGAISLKIGLAALDAMLLLAICKRYLALAWTELVGHVWRPLVAAVTMAGALHWCDPLIDVNVVVDLALKACIGGTTYAISMLVLWVASGRPAGLETTFIDLAGTRLPAPVRRVLTS